MKVILAVAALAGFLFGCAPRPEPQGGTFDNSIAVPERGVGGSAWPLSPGPRRLGPNPLRDASPSDLSPEEQSPDDGNPELMLPRRLKQQVFHI